MMMNQYSEDLVYDLVDFVLTEAPPLRSFTIDNLLKSSRRSYHPTVRIDALRFLESNGYIEKTPTGSLILTSLGREARGYGGYYKYEDKLTLDSIAATEKEMVELGNLESSQMVNNYLYKTRWIPHILSLIALIVSLIALLKDCSGREKVPVEKVELIKK